MVHLNCLYCNKRSSQNLNANKYSYGWVCPACARERGLVKSGYSWVPKKEKRQKQTL